jgi:hypothetical protein
MLDISRIMLLEAFSFISRYIHIKSTLFWVVTLRSSEGAQPSSEK